jgi:hypothetical protein
MSVQEDSNLQEAGEYEKKMQEEVPLPRYRTGTKKAGSRKNKKASRGTKKGDGTIYTAFKDYDTIPTLYD